MWMDQQRGQQQGVSHSASLTCTFLVQYRENDVRNSRCVHRAPELTMHLEEEYVMYAPTTSPKGKLSSEEKRDLPKIMSLMLSTKMMASPAPAITADHSSQVCLATFQNGSIVPGMPCSDLTRKFSQVVWKGSRVLQEATWRHGSGH